MKDSTNYGSNVCEYCLRIQGQAIFDQLNKIIFQVEAVKVALEEKYGILNINPIDEQSALEELWQPHSGK
ncbi:hypothetical protein [Crocosphaera sp. Alani8]|uniref:hypothetical protein n=1 Tax=Crocosphaera sp. Alani8 TaxID=3038952 RepID=UPI00313D3BEE